MPYLHQYDYVFALGTIMALLEAFNNGASGLPCHTLNKSPML